MACSCKPTSLREARYAAAEGHSPNRDETEQDRLVRRGIQRLSPDEGARLAGLAFARYWHPKRGILTPLRGAEFASRAPIVKSQRSEYLAKT